ncbi:glycerophosphodiester phosphodiesterase family protein [uncultured Cohaesibacter sp.]|uniref:glycerophosphodiester phosphodiesterase n=1 Tax=uncultured Cohaesibacter sp. TaxID=1002546 RepID=UPI0029313283|nr:glycerophosphodiester phosphodiesterase family protein [uncultured Cohaesibacter sp.]
MNTPVAIERNGHRTLLKWHRARRNKLDTPFTGSRIRDCMGAGGSVEIDLQVDGSGNFVVLHDERLEQSTTGFGPVNETSSDDLRGLHILDVKGEDSGERVMMLDDLADLVVKGPVREGAVLQLDMKDELEAFHDNSIGIFARTIAPVARHMILSGMDSAAVRALADAVKDLPVGYDPCKEDVVLAVLESGDFAGLVRDTLETAPWASMIYLEYQFVLAADRAGFDMIGAFHDAGKQVDAWTIRTIDESTCPQIERLLALKADQITTDDPDAFYAHFAL